MTKFIQALLTTTALICVGCENFDVRDPKIQNEVNPKRKFTIKAGKAAISNMEKKHGLHPVGIGAAENHKLVYLKTDYYYLGKVDIALARTLYVDAVNELVTQVNATKFLKPFLSEYPFTQDKAKVKIYIKDSEGNDPKPGEICLIERDVQLVQYFIKDKDNQSVVGFREFFFEAQEEIAKQSEETKSTTVAL